MNASRHDARGWTAPLTDIPRVAAREVLATVRAAASPIASALRPLPTGIAGDRAPVVLVHGYLGHPEMLRALARSLLEAGWHHIERPGYPSSRMTLEEIARRIDECVTPIALSRPVDLVGHSLGAVACRAWIKRFGGHRYVRRFVSLGGPHGGTRLYRFTPRALWPVLDPSGPWVRQLNDGPEPVPTTHIRARYDHQVLPPHPVQLEGATEHVLDQVGHNGLLWSARAHRAVIEALDGPAPPQP